MFASPSFPIIPCHGLLHVRTSSIRLRRDGLALDALGTGVVLAGVLANAGGSRVGSDRCLTGTVTVGVTGCVVGAETLLLSLLLLELLAGTGAAAEEIVSVA